MQIKAIPHTFYLNDTLSVAEKLLGKYLIRDIDSRLIIARIMETEAYIGPIDKACHAYGGKITNRTKTLYQKGGIAYVYQIYGMYYCLNAVSEPEGQPCAVLIRGAQIITGHNIASGLRYGMPYESLSKAKKKNISNGPGKLCKALAIDKSLNEASLQNGPLIIADEIEGISNLKFQIATDKRIGIGYAEEAVDFLWRFFIVE